MSSDKLICLCIVLAILSSTASEVLLDRHTILQDINELAQAGVNLKNPKSSNLKKLGVVDALEEETNKSIKGNYFMYDANDDTETKTISPGAEASLVG